MAVRDCDMFLLILLLLSVALTPVQPLLGNHPDEAEVGSGCEDAENYFDNIEVDDEDYYESEEEGSADQFETLIRGPPVFTDSGEDDLSDGISPDLLHEDQTNDKGDRTPQSTGKIIPESLVIKNRTHGRLNGKLIITNNLDQEQPGPELFFEDEEEQKPSEEEIIVKEIPVESLGSKMSVSVLDIIMIIVIHYAL